VNVTKAFGQKLPKRLCLVQKVKSLDYVYCENDTCLFFKNQSVVIIGFEGAVPQTASAIAHLITESQRVNVAGTVVYVIVFASLLCQSIRIRVWVVYVAERIDVVLGGKRAWHNSLLLVEIFAANIGHVQTVNIEGG
jgi:hypothetical protein